MDIPLVNFRLAPFFYCFREREKILDLFEALCGARWKEHDERSKVEIHYIRSEGNDVFLRQQFEGIGDRLQNTPRTSVARTKAGLDEADEIAKDIDEH